MRHVLIQPAADEVAEENLAKTVTNPVQIRSISRFLDQSTELVLQKLYPTGTARIWGVKPGKKSINKKPWEAIERGDLVLFTAKKRAFGVSSVTLKLHNPRLAEHLWKHTGDGQTWEYIYFLSGLITTNVSYALLNQATKKNRLFRGFEVLNEGQSQAIRGLRAISAAVSALQAEGADVISPAASEAANMPNRRAETFSTDAFQVGELFSREEIAELAHVAPLFDSREWTGIVEFSNCVVLFSTLDKSDLPAEHAYADCFSGEQFKWESQNRNTQSTPVIQRILSGDSPVLLFCRVHRKTIQGHAEPFVYAGQLRANRCDGERPVKVLFDLLNYQASPHDALARLYNWRPEGGRELAVVELPPGTPPRKGQGHQSDAKKRQAIESWAMEECRRHYQSNGFSLRNTSQTRPYDYIASDGGGDRRVEVKGCTGSLGDVIVTAGEVSAAREPGAVTDLFVLSEIVLKETTPGVFQCDGGKASVIRLWVPEDEHLTPTQFRYAVDRALRSDRSADSKPDRIAAHV